MKPFVLPYQLTKQRHTTHNYPVTAKSVTRIGIRFIFKAYSRFPRFFCTAIQHPAFMAGLLGVPTGTPVSLKTGYANPNNSATNPEIGISLGGSRLQGAFLMTTHVMYSHARKKVSTVAYTFILSGLGRVAA